MRGAGGSEGGTGVGLGLWSELADLSGGVLVGGGVYMEWNGRVMWRVGDFGGLT
jgi:hypothetical protein